MFLGEYVHTLDEKGRLTIPSKFRAYLERGLVITRGLDGCLFAFTHEDWLEFTTTLKEKMSFTQKSARDLVRFFFSGATDTTADRQGRILIPTFLREYANLESEVVIIGSNTRFELWNPERWREALKEVESNVEMIAEQFGNITF
ncbi:MAG: division/cell wall cluster transcriptional repressor MraZ [Anaerolineae bacterium]|nr:division/cell wall cluster transcriptional repressor MraZ [Anaerolineae bacterium]